MTSIVFMIVFVIGVIIYYALDTGKEKKVETTVSKTSIIIKQFNELNRKYSFWINIEDEYCYSIRFDSKSKFDRCGPELLNVFVLQDAEKLLSISQKCTDNRENYRNYLKQVDELRTKITLLTTEHDTAENIGLKKYREVEQRLISRNLLKPPVTSSRVIAVAEYQSPQGKNFYTKKWSMPITDVPERYERLVETESENEVSDYQRKLERAKMSVKLRYSILQRDGFRCQICGRGAEDGVKLHVDHIIPVSKGGKTVENNLRTLCEDCNLGKGARLEKRTEKTEV